MASSKTFQEQLLKELALEWGRHHLLGDLKDVLSRTWVRAKIGDPQSAGFPVGFPLSQPEKGYPQNIPIFLRVFVLHPGITPLGNDPEWFNITGFSVFLRKCAKLGSIRGCIPRGTKTSRKSLHEAPILGLTRGP